jgi:hypothetical protein
MQPQYQQPVQPQPQYQQPVQPQPQYQQPVQPQPQYQQQPQQQYRQPVVQPKDTTLAVLLELGAGGMFQTFGIGNIYAGSIGIGIALMLSYWVLQFINALLTMLLVGFVTLPLTWLIYMIVAPLLAANAAKKTQGV